MTNKQKYAEEILDIACSGNRVAIRKDNKRLTTCEEIGCCDCCFGDYVPCEEAVCEWAESEYIEQPKISKKDRSFLDYLKEEYKFIARDRNCKLFIYEAQPIRREKYWYLSNGHCLGLNRCLRNIDFPMVKWEDEPWLIEDLKKLEVIGEYEK